MKRKPQILAPVMGAYIRYINKDDLSNTDKAIKVNEFILEWYSNDIGKQFAKEYLTDLYDNNEGYKLAFTKVREILVQAFPNHSLDIVGKLYTAILVKLSMQPTKTMAVQTLIHGLLHTVLSHHGISALNAGEKYEEEVEKTGNTLYQMLKRIGEETKLFTVKGSIIDIHDLHCPKAINVDKQCNTGLLPMCVPKSLSAIASRNIINAVFAKLKEDGRYTGYTKSVPKYMEKPKKQILFSLAEQTFDIDVDILSEHWEPTAEDKNGNYIKEATRESVIYHYNLCRDLMYTYHELGFDVWFIPELDSRGRNYNAIKQYHHLRNCLVTPEIIKEINITRTADELLIKQLPTLDAEDVAICMFQGLESERAEVVPSVLWYLGKFVEEKASFMDRLQYGLDIVCNRKTVETPEKDNEYYAWKYAEKTIDLLRKGNLYEVSRRLITVDFTSNATQWIGAIYGCVQTASVSNLLTDNWYDELYTPPVDVYMEVLEAAKETGMWNAPDDRKFLKNTLLMPIMYGSTSAYERVDASSAVALQMGIQKVIPAVNTHLNQCKLAEFTDQDCVVRMPDIHSDYTSGTYKAFYVCTQKKEVVIDEESGVSMVITVGNPDGRNLAAGANTIHSLDGALARRIGVTIPALIDIHDAFMMPPGYLNTFRDMAMSFFMDRWNRPDLVTVPCSQERSLNAHKSSVPSHMINSMHRFIT